MTLYNETKQESDIGFEMGAIQLKSNTLHASDNDIPDPEFDAFNQFIFIRVEKLSDEIKLANGGTLYIPQVVQEKEEQLVSVGRVVKVGEHAGKRNHVSRPNVGDYVIFPKHSGARITVNGVKLIAIYDDAILARVPPPKR